MRLKDYPMTQVIARRSLDYRPKRRPAEKVIVEIGRPSRDPEGPDWYCPYRIAGFGGERVFPVFGVDPLQALILSLAGLSAEMTLWGRKDSALRWLGARHLGLEVHRILRFQRDRIRRAVKRRGLTHLVKQGRGRR